MYVNPFILGIISGAMLTIIALTILAVYLGKKK